MSSLSDWWSGFWDQVQHSPAILPIHYPVPASHVDKETGDPFLRDQHYFVIRINQIFIKYERQLWKEYAPMVLAVSEFDYDEDTMVVPFVVGPSLLEKDKIALPSGFLFSDTKVAGIHPYKGGGLKLTVILYQVKRDDLAKKLLKVVEKMASLLDFSQALATYLKVANVLVDTVMDLIEGDNTNEPIIGLRKEFDPFDDFAPGYFALIDSRETNVDVGSLWVKGNRLYRGDSMADSEAFTDADFVLYSIRQSTSRDDFTKLAFYSQWKVAMAESWTKDAEKWTSAQANWTTLCQMMALSADLITPQAENLADECYAQMESNHNRVTAKYAQMGAGQSASEAETNEDQELRGISERLNRVRRKSVAILE